MNEFKKWYQEYAYKNNIISNTAAEVAKDTWKAALEWVLYGNCNDANSVDKYFYLIEKELNQLNNQNNKSNNST